ncbi:hypothetical protein BKA60DRAFT_659540 [Fusarium oxysporum]|nr:hypothetical protein BKA60DRAFT_659540 [Fusarium oxysporum]
MAPLNEPRFPRTANPQSFLECPFHKYNSIQFYLCSDKPLRGMSCLWDHLRSKHLAYTNSSPWTCPNCREEIYDHKQDSHHDSSKCVTTSPGESGILLDSELQQYLDSTIGRKPEAAWPRTQFVEIAVPYLTAKARTTPLDTGYQTLILDTIYATYNSMSNDASQEGGAQPSQQYTAKPWPIISPNPYLQFPYNGTQAQWQYLVSPQQALPQSSHLQVAQSNHQSQDLQQPQQSHAEPTPNNYTQTSSYQQPPYSSSPQLLCDSSQPDMTPAEDPSTPASSIRQQSLDTTQPQPQEHPTRNEFGISLDSPRPNIISAENPSTRTKSIGQQSPGVSQPQHEEHSTTDWLDFSQYSPLTRVLDHPDYNPASHAENSNEKSLDMNNEGEDNGIDLTD